MPGEGCLLVGDLNKHVGNDDLEVKGNHKKISIGGHLVRDLLATCEGGPWTRIDPGKG